jgi:hypothetical protein
MRKGIVLIIIALLLSVPVAGAVYQPRDSLKPVDELSSILCAINGKKVIKEMSSSSIAELIDIGASHKQDFLTIYDKTKTSDEVAVAFDNIKPFFQALIDKGLTDKTVDDLNNLYYGIREKIREPRHKSAWKPQDGDGAKPLGIWNGLPTPVWANAVCGIFDAGLCAGFAGGTHAIIPTIGADAFLTYAFQGESISVGLMGGTLATTAFQVIIGFIGILLCTPLIMLMPYFMTGLCGFVFGVGF